MELLWFLDAPFWQKMYFIGTIVGMSIFMYFIFMMLEGWNTKLKNAATVIRKELALERERRRKFFSALIVIGLLIILIPFSQNAQAFDEVVAETVYHPSSTIFSSTGMTEIVFLRPDADIYNDGWVGTYADIDETTTGSDQDTTYLEGVTNPTEYICSFGNIGTYPAGTGYLLTAWVIERDEGAASYCDFSLITGATYYSVYAGDSDTTYTNRTKTWDNSPYTSTEWTKTEIDALTFSFYITDANPDVRVSQLAIRLTVYLPTWTTNPDDGVYWTKLGANDSSYIMGAEGADWPSSWFNFPDFSGTGYDDESYIVTLWTISKVETFWPVSIPQAYIRMTFDSKWYDTSLVGREYAHTAKSTWLNYSITSFKCPWTNLNWTITTINQIMGQLAKDVFGNIYFNELGLLIQTTTPPAGGNGEAPDYNLIFTIVLVCGCIVCVLFLVLTNVKTKS